MKFNSRIRQGVALPGPGVPSEVPAYDYSALIGNQLTLNGGGENLNFERALPRTAIIVRQLALKDWGTDWLEIKFHESFQYKQTNMEACLIRARWIGHPIGDELCPVFVLTDDRKILKTKTNFESQDFQFVTWGQAELCDNKAAPGA